MPHQCEKKEWQCHLHRCPHLQQTDTAEEMASEHPLVRILLGSTSQEILDVVECVYQGQYEVAPSVLTRRLQDQFMAKLHEKLSKCLVRAGLPSAMVTTQTLSRGRRYLWALSLSHARSPLVEGRRNKIAKWPRGVSLSRSSQHHSRGWRSRVQQQGPSPHCKKPVRNLPRLPKDPTGIPCLPKVHCTNSARISNCTTAWASYICSSSNGNRGGGRLVGCCLTVLWCTLQHAPIPCQDQSCSVCPRVPQRNRSVLTWMKTWVTQHHYQITWPASWKTLLIIGHMFHVLLPLWPLVPDVSPKWW